MSETLIIYAHPNKEGHSGYYLSTISQELDSRHESYEILDLYEMNFDPRLMPSEHYTSGHSDVSAQNKEIQDKIKAAHNLIFIFPTWWQGTPAILKGFIDRVFVAGFAFMFDEKGFPHGLLGPRKAVVLSSSGAPRFVARLLGDRVLKVITKDSLVFCGLKCKAFSVGTAKELSDKNKKTIKHNIRKALKFLKL